MTGKWLCDVCKKRTFETLEEATDHEATCKIHPFFQPKQQRAATKVTVAPSKTKKKKPTVLSDKPTHPFFEQASKKAKKSEENAVAMDIESLDEASLLDQKRALDFFAKQKSSSRQGISKRKDTQNSYRKGTFAPRFPVANHVIPPECKEATKGAAPSVPRQRQTPILQTILFDKQDDYRVRLTDTSTVISTEQDVLLHQAIADAMTATKGPVGPLVERYYYKETFQDSARQELEEFIERFKIERLEAQNRRKERHDLMRGIRKPKKKKKKRTIDEDDDDLWEDEDEQVKTTLCLITGPSGCGKSNLVYNVASDMECKSVLELHPGELRSGAQLRKFMEEATKSHSTRDMLRERNAMFIKEQQLVDSDDEDDEPEKKGAAVTIILLDEVDTLFEADAGFFPALSELAKTSKSPIVLTANTIPSGLNSAFTHISLDRLTVKECASKLTDIVRAEGFRVHGNMDDVAILGHCDMRRILHSIHLFAMSPPRAAEATAALLIENAESTTLDLEDSAPIVERVQPSSILADEISWLTITGKHFETLVHKSSDEVEVIVGDQVCPYARVINDTTIQTVCPPRLMPDSVDGQGYYHGTRHRSLAVAHPEVVVRARLPRHGVSSSNATIVQSVLGEKTKVLAKPRTVSLDVQFHGFTNESDDEENELNFNTNIRPSVTQSETPRDDDPSLVEKCLSMFEQALSEQQGTKSAILESADTIIPAELGVIDDVSFDCELASDAVFLQDVGLLSAPFLSGPCKGFGYTLTDEYPKRTNENSKPYVPVDDLLSFSHLSTQPKSSTHI